MGVKKAKKSRSRKSGGSIKRAATAVVSSALGAVGVKSRGGGGRRHSRETPEKLARKILILKFKKKLYKLKYGGR